MSRDGTDISAQSARCPSRFSFVTLAPADVRKEGSAFDLPIAIGILAGTGQIGAPGRLEHFALLGELGLDGSLRPVRGALPVALAAREAGLSGIILPAENVAEAAVIEGIGVRGASNLAAVVRFLDGSGDLPVATLDRDSLFRTASEYESDFARTGYREHFPRWRICSSAATKGDNDVSCYR